MSETVDTPMTAPDQITTRDTPTSRPASDTVNPTTPASDAASWFDTLPDGLKAEKSLASFKGKDVTAVVESFVNAQKSFGSRLPIPLPTDKPEERVAKLQRLHEALGRPTTPDEYQIELPGYEALGLTQDDAALTSFKQLAHKLGLSNEAVGELVKWQADSLAASQPDHTAQLNDCIKTLRDGDDANPGWGTTMPRMVAISKRAVDAHFAPDVQRRLEQAGFFNDPQFVRAMYSMGKALIEDNVLVGEEVDTSSGAMTAQQELDAIMGDPKGAYFNERDPHHMKVTERALDLRRFLAKHAS